MAAKYECHKSWKIVITTSILPACIAEMGRKIFSDLPNEAVEPNASSVVSTDEAVAPDEADEGDDDTVKIDAEAMSYADARALKKTYLAKLKRLER